METGVQRRLAAILAVDVVGFSRMMELDEIGTLDRLKKLMRDVFNPTVEGHGGRVVKLMGDGALVEFPSVVDALHCAVSFQEKVLALGAGANPGEAIRFRVGVNIGDIIAEGRDIYGDGVNIAARLEGMARPGKILVSHSVYEQARKTTKLRFVDFGERRLKNITAPLQVYEVEPEAYSDELHPDTATVLNRPAVAVLPFKNMSGDPNQEYFADGLTEELITVLSHWRLFPVISRMSAFAYKDKQVKVQQIAEELGVNYVVDGSVRKIGNRVRIAAQLIDAVTGHNLWAHNFDREIHDIFTLQDQIAGLIATTMQPELAKAEGQRSSTLAPNDLKAWDLLQRGLFEHWKYTPEANQKSKELFREAIRIDPEYSHPYTGLSLAYHFDILYGIVGARESAPLKMLETAKRAVELGFDDAMAHLALAFAFHRTHQYDRAVHEARKAVDLNPSDPLAHMELGSTLDFTGSSETAITSFLTSIALVPPLSMHYLYQCRVALGYLHAGDYDKAVEWAHSASNEAPEYPYPYVVLAASYAHMGRIGEAQEALEFGKSIEPSFVEHWHEWPLYYVKAQKQLVIDGLLKAGWTGDPNQLPSYKPAKRDG